MLRYDGRLITPSACLRIVKGFTVFRQRTQPQMCHSSEIPANCVNRSWFDRNSQSVN